MSKDQVNPGGGAAAESRLRDDHLRSLGLMLAGLAHELNTPLGVIASQCESLARCRARMDEVLARPDLGPDDVTALRQLVKHMSAGAPALETGLERVKALVRELRLAGRADAGHEVESVDLVKILEGDLILLQHLLRQGITVEQELASRPVVKGRPALLGQVFLNLIRNAVEAMDGQGTVRISVSVDGDLARVIVADTGPGLPDELLRTLFLEPRTTKCAEGGTGLGLFLSNQVLAKFGGAITAANQPGGGAMFTVTLPLA